MFVGMVLNKDVLAHTELVKNVSTYLNGSAEVAKRMLPKLTSAFGDSLTGENDSDADERRCFSSLDWPLHLLSVLAFVSDLVT